MRYIFLIRRHPSWFFAGCVVLGLGMSRLPFLAEPNGNLAVGPFVAVYVFAGLVAGALAPERPWRWGVAMVVAEPIVGSLHEALQPSAALVALLLMPVMAIKALPIVAGAYAGRGFLDQTSLSPVVPASAPDRLPWKIRREFLACWLVSSAAGLFLRDPWLSGAWVICGVAAASLLTVSFALRPFRSATVAVIGALMGFVVSLLRDAAFGGPSHNLLPFEVLLIGLVVFGTASVAAWTASGLKWWFRRRAARPHGRGE